VNRLSGKLYAAQALLQFAQHLKNWRQVFDAYRRNQPIPFLILRKGGATIRHGSGDDPIALFREIFVHQLYTRGFYAPETRGPGQNIVDLDANIGLFAIFMESRTRSPRIHCFEPAAQTRELLKQNVLGNKLERSIAIHPFGV